MTSEPLEHGESKLHEKMHLMRITGVQTPNPNAPQTGGYATEYDFVKRKTESELLCLSFYSTKDLGSYKLRSKLKKPKVDQAQGIANFGSHSLTRQGSWTEICEIESFFEKGVGRELN